MEYLELSQLKQLYDNAPNVERRVKNKIEDTKDITQAINYLKRFFFPLRSGGHFLLEDGKFSFYDDKTIKATFFNRMPKEVSEWYRTQFLTLFTPITDINKPQIDGTKINMCEGIKVKVFKKYDEYSTQAKEGVEVILNHIKEVMCSSIEEVYIYYLKLISNICKGKKNDVIIYQKSIIEGIGKSILWDFLTKYVLGKGVCVKANADPLRTSNNKILCGKILVLFEELPTFSLSEWSAVSGKLKDMATSDTLYFCDKYEKAFEAENINNYVINTNVDAIKNAEGRRYFIPPLSSHRCGDHKYFSKISKCFTDEIGEAFYSRMMEIDTKDFRAQRDMPETKEKLNQIVARLDSVYLFLKEEYVLKRKNIKSKTSAFFKEYEKFCETEGHKCVGKTDFFNRLESINICYKKSDGFHWYKIDYSLLQKIADKFKWIHETDIYKVDKTLEDDHLDDGIEPIEDDLIFKDINKYSNYLKALKLFSKPV